MTTHALIPARSGSKSIPNKNMALLGGKPLVQWAIEAARLACDEVFVVTDRYGRDIVKLAESMDAYALVRPDELATDDSLVIDLIEWFGKVTDAKSLVLVQPTSPFVSRGDIIECLHYGANSAQTITPVPHNFHEDNQRAVSPHGDEVRFVKAIRGQNKATKPPRYMFGNCVGLNIEAAVAQRTPFPRPSVPHVLDNPFRAIDIDGPNDLKLAEAILKAGLV